MGMTRCYSIRIASGVFASGHGGDNTVGKRRDGFGAPELIGGGGGGEEEEDGYLYV